MSSSVASRNQEFRDKPAPESEADVLRATLAMLRSRLPGSWETQIEAESPSPPIDA
jgi:hypothetical protein